MVSMRDLAALKQLVRSMERDLGFVGLTDAEKDIYLAAAEICDAGGSVDTAQLRRHELTRDISRPTFHRALRKLLSRGLLQRVQGRKVGRYSVAAPQ
jgi:predicted transcriptional regulator